MDIDLARTFLAIVETGSFVEAAKRVHVTQSTVSMRIRSLEDQLGKALFARNKAGATLTAAGSQFQKHALAMVRVWDQARLEVALPDGYQAALTIGGQYSLWDGFLLDWVAAMRTTAPEIAIRTQLGLSNALMQKLVDGTIDIGVMYTPARRPGFEVDRLFEESLVLVTSEPDGKACLDQNYIYVDWGPEFQADHSLNFPDLSVPGLYMELGSIGLQYLLSYRGSGYFPERLVRPFIATKQLRMVPDSPVFSYPAYVVYPEGSDADGVHVAIRSLKTLAKNHRPSSAKRGHRRS